MQETALGPPRCSLRVKEEGVADPANVFGMLRSLWMGTCLARSQVAVQSRGGSLAFLELNQGKGGEVGCRRPAGNGSSLL